MALLFAANGLIIGGYGGALPSIRERLDINASHISIMLFAAALAAIVAMQIGGRLSDSIGARQVSLAGLAILIAAAAHVRVRHHLPGRHCRSGAAGSRQRQPSTSP